MEAIPTEESPEQAVQNGSCSSHYTAAKQHSVMAKSLVDEGGKCEAKGHSQSHLQTTAVLDRIPWMHMICFCKRFSNVSKYSVANRVLHDGEEMESFRRLDTASNYRNTPVRRAHSTARLIGPWGNKRRMRHILHQAFYAVNWESPWKNKCNKLLMQKKMIQIHKLLTDTC